MSNENLQQMFVEDSPEQVNELANVDNLSKYVLDLQRLESEIEREEHNLKLKKAQADKISTFANSFTCSGESSTNICCRFSLLIYFSFLV